MATEPLAWSLKHSVGQVKTHWHHPDFLLAVKDGPCLPHSPFSLSNVNVPADVEVPFDVKVQT